MRFETVHEKTRERKKKKLIAPHSDKIQNLKILIAKRKKKKKYTFFAVSIGLNF